MELFVGLDVSMDETSICVVDRDGKIIKECKAATDPAAIPLSAESLCRPSPASWPGSAVVFTMAFQKAHGNGLPVIVVESVHMQKALSAQRNKTDRNDARGIAHMMRVGWFREVHVKDDDTQRLRVLLSGRRLLKRKLVDIENELRGSLKAFGIKIGAVSRGNFETRALELVEAVEPLLRDVISGMWTVRRAVWTEYKRLHNALVRVVRQDAVCRRFTTIPGVGPVTALAFKTAIDDSRRFAQSRTGLPPRGDPVSMLMMADSFFRGLPLIGRQPRPLRFCGGKSNKLASRRKRVTTQTWLRTAARNSMAANALSATRTT